ncbi:protein ATP1B4 isoform X2 [Pseudophryne corroboree]|uniref:protein ATP1B4 isoform X2 n=1 Tax=Pseudophryne corroboree TaxID=495146 RepID=UPI0030815FE8
MELNSTSPDQHGNYLHTVDIQDRRHSLSERHNQMEGRRTWAEWIQDVKLFIWNPSKKEFLGRNGKSWAMILLFYLLFYAFLTGMFSLCIYGLLLTISPYVPTYRDRVYPPAYDDDTQIANNVECTPGQYFLQEGEEHEERKACLFLRSQLQNCSGIEDPTFGFSQGKPCFLLKMNRILGFKAGSGTPINVTCGIYRGDESLLGAVNFYPANYFDLMYFPYYGKLTHVNYTSPLVAMQFAEVVRGHDVTIQCKIHGHDIINDHKTDRFLGRVVFILNIG